MIIHVQYKIAPGIVAQRVAEGEKPDPLVVERLHYAIPAEKAETLRRVSMPARPGRKQTIPLFYLSRQQVDVNALGAQVGAYALTFDKLLSEQEIECELGRMIEAYETAAAEAKRINDEAAARRAAQRQRQLLEEALYAAHDALAAFQFLRGSAGGRTILHLAR